MLVTEDVKSGQEIHRSPTKPTTKLFSMRAGTGHVFKTQRRLSDKLFFVLLNFREKKIMGQEGYKIK